MLWIIPLLLVVSLAGILFAQGGYDDGRVMIQGFMWESHQQGKQTGNGGYEYQADWQGKWYDHVKSKIDELTKAKFSLIWLPPPSQGAGAGYHPEEYHNFNNNYGSETQHKAVLAALVQAGIDPIADLVLNHRNGSGGWATFKNPDWPSTYICSTDEFWSENIDNLGPEDRILREAQLMGGGDFLGSKGNWDGARDLDHTNPFVRQDIKGYLCQLKALGYKGWRYDFVKGFDAIYVAEYDYASSPTFAVGEYWDGNVNLVTAWVDGTKLKGHPDPAERACCAFDFPTYDLLKYYINNGMYDHLPAISFKDGVHDGLIAVNRNKAVTFLENHDTGFPLKQFDSFGNNDKLMQGYAFILTHPGIPCVYWKHYFEWNRGNEIKPIIKARKYAGVHSGSYIKTEVHGNDYVAIVGDKSSNSSTLIVKIGYGWGFNPDSDVWGMEAAGPGYAVWVRKTKKMETQAAVEGTN
jgi:alpha-amylase